METRYLTQVPEAVHKGGLAQAAVHPSTGLEWRPGGKNKMVEECQFLALFSAFLIYQQNKDMQDSHEQ